MKSIIFVLVCLRLVICVEISVSKPSSVQENVTTTTTQTPSTISSTTLSTGETTVNATIKVENSTTVDNGTTSTTTALPSTTQVSPSTTTVATTGTSTETTPVILNPFSGYINRRADNKVVDYYCNCDFQVSDRDWPFFWQVF